MTLEEAKSVTKNIMVIAKKSFWGCYKGKLEHIRTNMHAQDERHRIKAVVKILECIELPSHLTLDGKNRCSRPQYKTGEIIEFDLVDVRVDKYG